MGAFTRRFPSVVDGVVTECFVYSPTEFEHGHRVSVHIGLPTGDIITNVLASEFDGEDYDLIVGMDVIQNGDLAVTNANETTTFSFRIPSRKEIDFEKE